MRSTTKRPDLRRPAVAATALTAAGLVVALILRPVAPEPPAPNSETSLPVVPTPPPAPVEAAPPPPSADGLRLSGLLGLGAVIALPDGRQSFFAIGREVRPGLRVARIEQQHVVLASAGGELRLGFDGVAQASAAAAPAAGAGSDEAALRDETLRYRLGLAPRQAGGRVSGFVVRPGVSMPMLERAGLHPGDVILSVNGSGFNEERMLELAWEIANSERTEFEVERGGRHIQLGLDRPSA